MDGNRSFDPIAIAAQSTWVRQLARELIVDRDSADDVAQDALVVALERPDREGREPHELGAWLNGVVRKLASKLGRSAARRRDREANVARGEREPSTAELCERVDGLRRLSAAVLELDEPYRSTVLLRFVEDLPPREIAARHRVPVATVKTRLARALANLRRRLERDGRDSLRALLPWCSIPRSVSKSIVTTLLVNTKLKLAVAALLALAACWIVFGVRTSAPKSDELARAANAASLEVPPASQLAAAVVANAERNAVASFVDANAAVDPESQVRGLVVDRSGAPIAGAEIELRDASSRPLRLGPTRDDSGESAPLVATKSDASGHFALAAERWHEFDLRARAPTFATVRRNDVLAGSDLRIVLDRAAALEGRVSNAKDDSPIAGARVNLQRDVVTLELQLTTETDASGKFRFDDLPNGSEQLSVGLCGRVGRDLQVELQSGETRHEDIRLDPPAARIQGRVTELHTGSPIAGARVSDNWTLEPNVITDAEGKFELPVAASADDWELFADAVGYGTCEAMAHGVADDVSIRLVAGLSAIGVVIDASGSPVAGVKVEARSSVLRNGRQCIDWRTTTSDAEGRFHLDSMRRDQVHTFCATKTGFGATLGDFPANESDVQLVDLGRIELYRSGRIGGRVVDESGAPIERIVVALSGAPEFRIVTSDGAATGDVPYGWDDVRRSATTDSRGRFSFGDLPPGAFGLSASLKGIARAAGNEVKLTEAEQRDDIELKLDLGASIHGVVVNRDGKPVPGTSVTVYADASLGRQLSYNLARSDGSFSLRGLERGAYVITAETLGGFTTAEHANRYAPLTLTEVHTSDEPLRIVLQPAQTIEGRVLGPDEQPIFRCQVQIANEPDPWRAVQTDRDGKFKLFVAEGAVIDIDVIAGLSDDGFIDPARVDEQGRLDPGFIAHAIAVHAGATDVVIRLAKSPTRKQ